jgi:hypothetical protein
MSKYRAAARAVGVQLKITHMEEHHSPEPKSYRFARTNTPLGVELLNELKLSPAQRSLLARLINTCAGARISYGPGDRHLPSYMAEYRHKLEDNLTTVARKARENTLPDVTLTDGDLCAAFV